MKVLSLRSLIAAALVVTLAPSLVGDDITSEEFRRLQQALTPDASEPWRTIPWKIALLDAQHVAASQSKPIFIWAMDGHPLGCT
jgi:hypothetical protein